ncbi:hypothetical protein OKW45_007292 [Paraburkholderia sp. WSM4175]
MMHLRRTQAGAVPRRGGVVIARATQHRNDLFLIDL